MNDRVRRLRTESMSAQPMVSSERARLITAFYQVHFGRHPVPILRALAFRDLCEKKTLWIGPGELIVGERGPAPKVIPTFPELTCHSVADLQTLDRREKTSYRVPADVLEDYETEVIPYWRGRSLRDRIIEGASDDWRSAYDAGMFTEFMEQRAPGHTVADGKIYERGLLDFQHEIATARKQLDRLSDTAAPAKLQQLEAMEIAAGAAILFAHRHAELARSLAAQEPDPMRRAELERIADICSWVPEHAPRDFHEALQMYWFCHLAVITELNGWDAYSPGHLDQHLAPFYEAGLADGSLTREHAEELLGCFLVKFNNHPAPPKVGVTAEESGTYTDFAAINLGGLQRDGTDGTSEISHLILEVIDDLHLVQPNPNVQISIRTPNRFVDAACAVISKGYGYPSVFNTDAVVQELLRQGKTLEDAREGGTSGCVEAGAFGKEAYVLTGYFNLPKVLELALNNGVDPRSGRQIGLRTGEPAAFTAFDDVLDAWKAQLRYLLDVKIRENLVIEHLYASEMPAPFLSLITSDCIANARDYNAGGARYNTSYIQGVGIGTLTDSLAALRKHVFIERTMSIDELVRLLGSNFVDDERTRQLLRNRAPKWGNDDPEADELMREAFRAFVDAVDGRPNGRGGRYAVDMLPTTSHIYFGSVTGATPDGRLAGTPVSEGISPVQGMDRLGPTAVLRSAAKMDHSKTGGTLLNMKLSPGLITGEAGIALMRGLIRTYFGMGGHHIQFNVVRAEALREAQLHPDEHRDLIVRVAGYSDYFCDLGRSLQDEIMARTEHGSEALAADGDAPNVAPATA